MKHLRLASLIVGIVLCIGVSDLSAQTPKQTEPTEEQVETAKKAFEKLGATFNKEEGFEQKLYVFVMPAQITDKDLKNLPAVPFLFVLDFRQAKMTDARLKEIAGIKNLTGVFLPVAENEMTDAGMKEIAKIKDLTALSLESSKVTDAGLKEIAKQKNLKMLALNVAELTDAGLKVVADLENLAILFLDSSKVTDAGLKEIAKLKKLKVLFLNDGKMNDAKLKEIANLKNLKELYFFNAEDITKAELNKLRKDLPNCTIHRGFLDIP
jgi:internalin A